MDPYDFSQACWDLIARWDAREDRLRGDRPAGEDPALVQPANEVSRCAAELRALLNRWRGSDVDLGDIS